MANFNTLIKVKNMSNSFDVLFPVTKAANVIVDEATDKRLPEKLSEIDSAIASKISATEKGVATESLLLMQMV